MLINNDNDYNCRETRGYFKAEIEILKKQMDEVVKLVASNQVHEQRITILEEEMSNNQKWREDVTKKLTMILTYFKMGGVLLGLLNIFVLIKQWLA